jgi:hypothetical protein
MRLNQFRLCMHADFHRKSFAYQAISDSRADNSGFAADRCARSRASRRTIAANGKFPSGEWQYGIERLRERSEDPAVAIRGIARLREY